MLALGKLLDLTLAGREPTEKIQLTADGTRLHWLAEGALEVTPIGARGDWPVYVDERIAGRRVSMGAGEHGATTTEYTFAVQRNTDPNGIYKGGATYRGKVPSAQPSYPRPTPSPQSTGQH